MFCNRKKTATVTWITYENCGSYLQAYALQKTILKLGFKNKIISDEPYITNYIRPKYTLISIIKRRIKLFLGLPLAQSELFDSFRRKYLKIDEESSNLSNINRKYDIFICGSDQIWSPYLPVSPFFYLNFVSKKKIAYAPSTGTCWYNDDYVKKAIPLIQEFDKISVREECGKRLLSLFINNQVKVVLDPTLLLKKDDWMHLVKKNQEGDYIVCYFLSYNQLYIDSVVSYARKQSLSIVWIDNNRILPDINCYSAGPTQFLTYICHSKCVFTDSYHASIFSIIFNKSFVTFKRFKDKTYLDQNERISELFAKLNLSNRFVDDSISVNDLLKNSIKWNIVEAKIEKYRKESLLFLQNALTDGFNM